jgi:hypothetical protein
MAYSARMEKRELDGELRRPGRMAGVKRM